MSFAVVSWGKSKAKLCNYSPAKKEQESTLELRQFKTVSELKWALTDDGRLTLKIKIRALSSTVFKQFKKWTIIKSQ
jgi:hypothetical protein